MMKKTVVSALVGLALTGTFMSTQAAVTIENEVTAFKGKILKVEVHNATTKQWVEIQGETMVDKLGTTIEIEKNASELPVGVYDLLRYEHEPFTMQGQVTVKGAGNDWDGTYKAVKESSDLVTKPKNINDVYGYYFEKDRQTGEDVQINPGITAPKDDITKEWPEDIRKKYTKEYVKELVRIAGKKDSLRTNDERNKYRNDYSGIPRSLLLAAMGALGYYDDNTRKAYEASVIHFEVKEKEGKKYIDGSSDVSMNYDAHEGLWSHLGWKKGSIQSPSDKASYHQPLQAEKTMDDRYKGNYFEYKHQGGSEKYEYFTNDENGKKYLHSPYNDAVAPTADAGKATTEEVGSDNKYSKTPSVF